MGPNHQRFTETAQGYLQLSESSSATADSKTDRVGNWIAREEWKRDFKLMGICGGYAMCSLGCKTWEP